MGGVGLLLGISRGGVEVGGELDPGVLKYFARLLLDDDGKT